jgi:hypothetical protein
METRQRLEELEGMVQPQSYRMQGSTEHSDQTLAVTALALQQARARIEVAAAAQREVLQGLDTQLDRHLIHAVVSRAAVWSTRAAVLPSQEIR